MSGVSAGAFIAASLANRISCTELCRIFMGVPHAELKFVPERFLRPAYREYFERAARLPSIARDALKLVLSDPLHANASEILAQLSRALPSGIFDNETIHDFLEESFLVAGKGNSFTDLDCNLYVVAVDLDSGASVRFWQGRNTPVCPSPRRCRPALPCPACIRPVASASGTMWTARCDAPCTPRWRWTRALTCCWASTRWCRSAAATRGHRGRLPQADQWRLAT